MNNFLGEGIRRLMGILIGVGLLIGCQSSGTRSDGQSTGVSDAPASRLMESGTSDTPAYFYDSFHLGSSLSFPDSLNNKDTTQYIARFPYFENGAIQAFVLKSQLGSDSLNLRLAAETFIREYEAFQVSFPFPRPWNHETSSKVQQITGSYIGLQTDHYNYTGGAHGNYNTLFTHFWLPENLELEYGDLIDTSQINALLPVAEQYFWTLEKQRNPELSPDLYFFEDNRFYLPENIAFERDSLLFLYNIYEIKPYVFGQTELRVPYKEINRFLTGKARAIIQEIKKK